MILLIYNYFVLERVLDPDVPHTVAEQSVNVDQAFHTQSTRVLPKHWVMSVVEPVHESPPHLAGVLYVMKKRYIPINFTKIMETKGF